MQHLARFSLAVAATLPLLLHCPGASAVEPEMKAAITCHAALGHSIEAADKALRKGDQRGAIACLIEALLELTAAADERQTPKALIAPKGAWRNQR
jgi:hypothetical protein